MWHGSSNESKNDFTLSNGDKLTFVLSVRLSLRSSMIDDSNHLLFFLFRISPIVTWRTRTDGFAGSIIHHFGWKLSNTWFRHAVKTSPAPRRTMTIYVIEIRCFSFFSDVLSLLIRYSNQDERWRKRSSTSTSDLIGCFVLVFVCVFWPCLLFLIKEKWNIFQVEDDRSSQSSCQSSFSSA